LVNIGTLSYEDAISGGKPGPVARSAGIKKDIRFSKTDSYGYY
jgi:NADH:ubiquinone oxidoreductase subunit D